MDTFIFVSYTRKDQVPAAKLVMFVRAVGFAIPFDKDSVHTGQDWKLVIAQTLLRPACESVRYQDHWATIFPRHGCARARKQNREHFEVRFRAENMVCHIFLPKAKRPTERGRRSKSAERGRAFKWRHGAQRWDEAV
jgi:hypothetical protein